MQILCIGSATKDIFFPTSEGVLMDTPEDLLSQRKIAFEVGAKYHIDNRFESLGGCSVNVAVGLKRTGEKVACYSSIGDDVVGKWIFQHIAAEGIDLKNIKIQRNCQNDLSAIVVDKNTGERVIFSCQTSNNKLEIESERIENADWIFIGDVSGDWKKNIAKIIEISKEKEIKIAFNPRQKMIHDNAVEVAKIISKVEIVFLNKDEATEILSADVEKDADLNDEKHLLKELRKMGCSLVVITDGARGAWAYDGNQMFHVDAMLQKAVDTTGAGDAFTSGFFSAHVKAKEISECLSWGIVNSSNSVLFYGGQEGLLGQNEIEQQISQVKIVELN